MIRKSTFGKFTPVSFEKCVSMAEEEATQLLSVLKADVEEAFQADRDLEKRWRKLKKSLKHTGADRNFIDIGSGCELVKKRLVEDYVALLSERGFVSRSD